MYHSFFTVRDTIQKAWLLLGATLQPTTTDTLLSSTVATQPSISASTNVHSGRKVSGFLISFSKESGHFYYHNCLEVTNL